MRHRCGVEGLQAGAGVVALRWACSCRATGPWTALRGRAMTDVVRELGSGHRGHLRRVAEARWARWAS